MKKMKHLLLLALLALGLSANAQTIFVRAAAAGANDGSSWTNAYTSLGTALASATSGTQIWVASGIYKPVDTVGFVMNAGVKLYGGFAGNETMLSQRDINAYPTVLSGDLAGNDVSTDITLNRSDNAVHVIAVQGDTSVRAEIDGFTIRNGQTETVATQPDFARRGGGVLTTTKLTIANCRFTENFGLSGGSVAALDAAATGIIIINCIFENNLATSQCAGAYLRNVNNALVQGCIFRNNITNRGCLYPERSNNVVVDSCLFEDNETGASQFGAGMFTWQSNFLLKNSIFRNNIAANAAGMYNDGRENTSSFVIDNCLFEGNSTAGFGGAISNWQCDHLIKNCTFRNNTANNGGAINNDGRENTSAFTVDSCLFENNTVLDFGGAAMYNFRSVVNVSNSEFTGNTSPNSAAAVYNGRTVGTFKNCLFENGQANFGGAMSNYSSPTNITIEDCNFVNNRANTSGGALINGFTAIVNIKNSNFEFNNARFGGACFNQNDTTALTVEGSRFASNNGDDAGGAINISAGIKATITDCLFEENSSDLAGALAISEDSLDLTEVDINRCVFRNNLCFSQAGAINVENSEVEITNTLFYGNSNFSTEERAGGAISNNGFNGKASNVKAVNCTFSENFAPIGAGIAQFSADTGSASLVLQNCIFNLNITTNYELEGGTAVTVTSLGGNLSSDNSLDAFLTGTNDLIGADPLFVSPDLFDYHLLPGSPCIDKGIAAGAPTVDLDGITRDATPDMGAYEFKDIATANPIKALPLALQPNPANDYTMLQIENEWAGRVLVQVKDAAGKSVKTLVFEKQSGVWNYRLSLDELPSGTYFVHVRVGALQYAGGLMKG